MASTPNSDPGITAAGRPGSISEAAERYDLSKDTILRLIAAGQIKAWRLGPPSRGRGRAIIRVDLDEVADLFKPIPTVGSDDAKAS